MFQTGEGQCPSPVPYLEDMVKTYIAGTILSLTIKVNGTALRISFDPKTVKGSTYTTDNGDIQTALESHPRFGKSYTLAPQPKPAVRKEEPRTPLIRKIEVDSLAEAKEILAEKGISRTKLRTKADIEKAAKENKIEFVFK